MVAWFVASLSVVNDISAISLYFLRKMLLD